MNNFPFEVEKLWSSVSNRAEKETIVLQKMVKSLDLVAGQHPWFVL